MSVAALSLAPSAPRFLAALRIRHKVAPLLSGRASLSFPPSSPLPTGDSCEEVASTSFHYSSTSYLESVPSAGRRLVGAGMCVFLAASFAADANATRIEYYASVCEPLCDLNYARSGIGYCDVSIGTGAVAPRGELINVHYIARFADDTVFDSSYKRGRPLTMRIGAGPARTYQGILGGGGVPPMLVGGKRKLLIPSLLAYGPEPAGCFQGDCNIPANATLIYDILFVGIYK